MQIIFSKGMERCHIKWKSILSNIASGKQSARYRMYGNSSVVFLMQTAFCAFNGVLIRTHPVVSCLFSCLLFCLCLQEKTKELAEKQAHL